MPQHSPPRFDLYGISPHLSISSAADLYQALDLDPAHWVATSAPVDTLNCDQSLLSILKRGEDGRITYKDMRKNIEWLLAVFSDHSGIDASSDVLKLASLNRDHGVGAQIYQAAVKIRNRVAGDDTNEISLKAIRTIKAQVESTPVSEAGVVLPEATGSSEIQDFLNDIVATIGGTPHPSGKAGVSEKDLQTFLDFAGKFIAWSDQGDLPSPADTTEIMPLGTETAVAYAAMSSVRGKLDQFFAQCEAAALDERFVQRMGWQDAELAGLDFDDPAAIQEILEKAPIARANRDRILDLAGPLNPQYATAMETFRKEVMARILKSKQNTLSSLEWQQIKTFFTAHQQWLDARSGEAVAPLGRAKLERYCEGNHAEAVRRLIADSSRTAIMLDGIRLVERAVVLQHLLISFANNFVSFPDLYDVDKRAMFEMGTLVMDGRRFNMAVRVIDRKQHTPVAETSGMFTLYIELTDIPGTPPIEVAVPVTAGSKGNLCIGKRGIFFDVLGREYGARVVQIIDNPISFIEALSSPFKKMGKMLTGKIESWTSEADKKFESQTSSALGGIQQGAAAPAAKTGITAAAGGMVMGTGVALAALGSAAAYITKTLAEISWTGLLLGILGALMVVMIPLSLVAFLKLRRRDLSAILEGAGWAINARMRLTGKQGRHFARRPPYPKDAKGTRKLLFRRILWTIFVVLLIALLAQQGNRLLVDRAARSASAFEKEEAAK